MRTDPKSFTISHFFRTDNKKNPIFRYMKWSVKTVYYEMLIPATAKKLIWFPTATYSFQKLGALFCLLPWLHTCKTKERSSLIINVYKQQYYFTFLRSSF
jgi:hypothetical protein